MFVGLPPILALLTVLAVYAWAVGGSDGWELIVFLIPLGVVAILIRVRWKAMDTLTVRRKLLTFYVAVGIALTLGCCSALLVH
jgi:hypothetical protein